MKDWRLVGDKKVDVTYEVTPNGRFQATQIQVDDNDPVPITGGNVFATEAEAVEAAVEIARNLIG